MRLTVVFVFFLGVVNAQLLSNIASALGIGRDEPTTSAGKTLVPPATVSASATSAKSTKSTQPSSSSSNVRESTGKSTSASSATTATTKSKSTDSRSTSTISSSDDDSSTITTAPTTLSTLTTTSAPPLLTSATPPSPIPTIPDQPSSPPSSQIPAGGIAVAVIMSIAVVAALIWMLFRYHPTIRSWYLARQEKKLQERSYRDGIDGPFASKGLGGYHTHGVRNEALGGSRPTTAASSRKSMLSFFAPKTVKLGNGKEIRRKPVNWGAGASDVPPIPMPQMSKSSSMVELPGHGGLEKVALAEMAAPMARNTSTKSYLSATGSSSSSGDGRAVSGFARSDVSSLGPGQRPVPVSSPSPVSALGRDVRSNVSSPSLAARDWSVSSPSLASPQIELPGSSTFIPRKPSSRVSPSPVPSSPVIRNELPGSSPVVVVTQNELPGSIPVMPAPAPASTPTPTSPVTTTPTPIPPNSIPTPTPIPTPLPTIPIPAIPADTQRRDMHQILSRKSIFELA